MIRPSSPASIEMENALERYSRQISLFGTHGQEKIFSAKVLVIGAGGLGSPASFYLAAAGVGQIGIVDGDKVELSNLQRQILHGTKNLNRPKVFSAQETLNALNPDVKIFPYNERATADNIADIIFDRDYDFVLDCTDNFAAKFLINDTCVKLRKPFTHAGILHFGGQLMTCLPFQSACCRCIFEEPPPETFREGIFNVTAGVIGTLQAAEALKFFLGVGELLTNCLLTFDALKSNFRRVKISRNKNCAACGEVNSC